MYLRIFVILRLLFLIIDVSAQDVSNQDGFITSQIKTSDVPVNDLSDIHSNSTNSENSTSDENNGLMLLNLTSHQNNSNIDSKLSDIARTNTETETASNTTDVPVTEIKSSSAYELSIRKVDIGIDKIFPNKDLLNVKSSNATKLKLSTAKEDTDHIATVNTSNSKSNDFNDVSSTLADETDKDVPELIVTDATYLANSSSDVNDVKNTGHELPNGSSISNETSLNGPVSTEPDESIHKTKAAANVVDNGKTRHQTNMMVTNTSVDSANMLPEIIWKPGIKQPQTMSDLIRMTGADIKFITSQFGSDINKNESIMNSSNSEMDTNKTDLNVSDNDGTLKIDMNRKVKTSPINKGDKLTDTTVKEKFHITGRKVETTFPDISQSVAMIADGLIPKAKFNTRQPVQTVVVVKQPGNVSSPRLDTVSHLKSSGTSSRDASSLPNDEFQRDREIGTPTTRQGSLPISSVSQADIASGRIISFGNNPHYTIGTGSSVQIPQFTSRNLITAMDPAARLNQGLSNHRSSRRGVSDIPYRVDQPVPGVRFTAGTFPFLRDDSRFETRGRSLSTPTRSSGDFVRADFVRNSMPIQGNFVSGSARNSVFGGQVFDVRLSTGASSVGHLPIHNGFRSATSAASFDETPFIRGVDSRTTLTGSVRGTSAMSSRLGDLITREIRQRADVVTRNDRPGEFARQQSFGDDIGFSRPISSPSQTERSFGFRREFPQTRDSSDRFLRRAESFRGTMSRDGPGFSAPVRISPFTTGAFGSTRLSSDITGIRTPMIPAFRVIGRRIRPFGRFTYQPYDIFVPSPYDTLRPF